MATRLITISSLSVVTLERFNECMRSTVSRTFVAWLIVRHASVLSLLADTGIFAGPIVRINPDELHCSDPAFVDEIYAGGNRIRDKWQHGLNTGATGPIAVGGFSTRAHELHRIRRMPMNRFFSRSQMLKLEEEVHEYTQRTCDKMLHNEGPFDLKDAFNCYTADIISQYCFGEPMGFIAQEGWKPNFSSWVKSFFDSAYMVRHIAPVRAATAAAPAFAKYMGDDMKQLMEQLQVVIPGHIQHALDDKESGRIFADLIQNESLPESEKTVYRLSGEGFNLLAAGTETTAVSDQNSFLLSTISTLYVLCSRF